MKRGINFDINFDKNDDYQLPMKKNYKEENLIVATVDFPIRFYQGADALNLSPEYPNAYVYKEMRFAQVAADRAARKFKCTFVVWENYGGRNERTRYITID